MQHNTKQTFKVNQQQTGIGSFLDHSTVSSPQCLTFQKHPFPILFQASGQRSYGIIIFTHEMKIGNKWKEHLKLILQ